MWTYKAVIPNQTPIIRKGFDSIDEARRHLLTNIPRIWTEAWIKDDANISLMGGTERVILLLPGMTEEEMLKRLPMTIVHPVNWKGIAMIAAVAAVVAGYIYFVTHVR